MQDSNVGRIVLFYPDKGDRECSVNEPELLPAIIVKVLTPTKVNLQVFTDNKKVVYRANIERMDRVPDIDLRQQPYWAWPDYKR